LAFPLAFSLTFGLALGLGLRLAFGLAFARLLALVLGRILRGRFRIGSGVLLMALGLVALGLVALGLVAFRFCFLRHDALSKKTLRSASKQFTLACASGSWSGYASTVIPMLRAVPSTMRMAWSSSRALRSAIFRLAISRTCFLVTVNPLYLPLGFSSAGINSPPFFFSIGMPAACLSRMAAGGLFTSKVKLRSLYTVITTGTGTPRLSLVRSLNWDTNCPMLTPCWPKAGPTGGPRVACPPATCTLTCP